MQNVAVVLSKFRHNRITSSIAHSVHWSFIHDTVSGYFLSLVSFLIGFYLALDSFLPALLGTSSELTFTQPLLGLAGFILAFTFLFFATRFLLLAWVSVVREITSVESVYPPPSSPSADRYDPRWHRM